MNKKEIKRFVLDNALNYDGKANSGSVISKILGTNPELKNSMALNNKKMRFMNLVESLRN